MSMLRIWLNLHRGLRLLRRIAASRGRSDVDKVVEDAVAHAEDIGSRMDAMSKKSRKDLKALEARITQRFNESARQLNSFQGGVDSCLKRELAQIRVRTEELGLSIQATNRTTLEQVRASSQSVAELTDQVAALREYISKQQEQVRRLQDGYDWTILKNFSLRMIRCIDSIEKQLEGLEVSSPEREDIELTRNELVFALAGSGFERFTPDVDTEYRGQEKFVKVVGKVKGDAREQEGRIARIAKPGYFFHADRDGKLLVRCAEVIIFAMEEGRSAE